jgi:hypothetical protein
MFFDFKPSSHDWINKVSNDYMSYRLWEDSMSNNSTQSSSYTQSTYTGVKVSPVDPADTAFNFLLAIWAILGIIFAIVVKVNVDSWVADLLAVVLSLSPIIFIFAYMRYAPSKKISEIPAAAVIDRNRVNELSAGFQLKIMETVTQGDEAVLIATDMQDNPLFFVPEDIKELVEAHWKTDPKFKCKMLPSSPWTAMKVFYTS